MTRFEITLPGQSIASAPAELGPESDLGSGPAGVIARSPTSPALNAALFAAAIPATSPAPAGSMPEHRRSTSSSELWVQVTLCVIVTLLLLTVISLPKGSDVHSESSSQRSAYELHVTLQKLRTAVSDYRFDHGVWPGMGLDTAQDMSSNDARARILEQQLTAYSDIAGRTSAGPSAGYALGPYLEGHVPVNPIDGLASVRVLGEGEEWPALPDDSTGWIYRPRTGEVRANCRGFVPVSSLRYYDL